MLPNRREPSPQWARLGSAGADEVNGGSRSGQVEPSRAELPFPYASLASSKGQARADL